MKKILFIVAAAALSLTACKKEETVAQSPYLKVSQENPILACNASSIMVGVNANNEWEYAVSMGNEWISAEKLGDSIKISVTANAAYDNRMGAVRIQSGKLIRAVSITQMAFPNPDFIKVEPEVLEFTADGGSKDVEVTANCDWTATVSDPTWCSISASSGQTKTITVTVTENENTSKRSATVIFQKGKKRATLTVNQASGTPFKPEPVVLAIWDFRENDDDYLKSHNPKWDYNNPNINTDWILVAEDNVNTAHWVLGSTSDRPSGFTPRSAISSGIAFNGMWTDDGLQFSIANVSAAKGMVIRFACGIKAGNKNSPAKWGIKMSTDGGNTWKEGDTKIYTAAGDEVAYIKNKTIKAHHEIYSDITLDKDIKKKKIIVYLYCIDGNIQLGGGQRTSPVSTMRFCPAYVKSTTSGARISLENAAN